MSSLRLAVQVGGDRLRYHSHSVFHTAVMAATPPTKQSLLHLYHSMLRTSQSFSSYNFRNYFVRRTKSTFRDIQVYLGTAPYVVG